MSLAKEKDLNSLSQVGINYIFFGFYLFFIAIIHVYHIFLIEVDVTFSRYFFLFYAIVQCAIETLLLVLFANAVKIFFRTTARVIYSLVVFFLLLTHVIDFPLVRFMGMSFWYGLNFISGESPQNFLELLYASNVSLFVWILAGLAGFGILFSGIFFYFATERWTSRRPFVMHYTFLAAILCTLCLFLMSWDYSTHKWVQNTHFERYEKTLPWKSTFFPKKQEYFSLAFPLKMLPSQEELMKQVDTLPLAISKKPDIFLFVIESLREDYIHENHAPHLTQFKKDHLSFDLALANANATNNSWFSLFYSTYPFYWGKVDTKQWMRGCIPLMLLKKLGYSIHCYSSARLTYYQMDHLIFGQNNYLADELLTFDNNNTEVPCMRDKKGIEKMIEQIQDGPSGGRVFIMFMDSTHHDYSWPKDEPVPFAPYEDKINFVSALTNSGLEQIKNRYRNAIYYVDSLFGRFMQALNAYPGGKEAVVIVTADHGEEFYEGGHLFHASGLSHPQMHVPLYYKWGDSHPFVKKEHCAMTCHMDIFPTLFHYLTGKDCMRGILQGQSIFSTQRWPFTITGRFNGSRSPCEFSIHNGRQKLTATFSDERDIFNSKRLRINSTKDLQDECIPCDVQSIKEQFGGALEHIFSP